MLALFIRISFNLRGKEVRRFCFTKNISWHRDLLWLSSTEFTIISATAYGLVYQIKGKCAGQEMDQGIAGLQEGYQSNGIEGK